VALRAVAATRAGFPTVALDFFDREDFFGFLGLFTMASPTLQENSG
jgi:hypothetical protein